jgi:hypothetical protein
MVSQGFKLRMISGFATAYKDGMLAPMAPGISAANWHGQCDRQTLKQFARFADKQF